MSEIVLDCSGDAFSQLLLCLLEISLLFLLRTLFIQMVIQLVNRLTAFIIGLQLLGLLFYFCGTLGPANWAQSTATIKKELFGSSSRDETESSTVPTKGTTLFGNRTNTRVESNPLVGSTNAGEPNQERWLKWLALPHEMINFTAPHVSAKVELVIIVVLLPQMAERRAEIRGSWASSSNSDAIQNGLVSVLFAVSFDSNSHYLIKEENKKYGDILVVRGQESYKGLVYKLLLTYRWLTKYCPEVDVAKVDSDVVLDVDRLHHAVRKDARNHIVGFLWKGAKVNRNSTYRWYIPSTSYSPAVLPLYANGPLYVFSSCALKAVLLEAPFHPVFEVEDAFFTGVLAEAASVKRTPHKGIFHEMPKAQRCDRGKPTIIGYPVHETINLTVKYEKMNTIPCY